ncbi:MAG: DUF3488 domain-containing protein [Deltaproteobacteria bacterium]|nr:DUF3488 domain-containing protein [Deltaproteobacteria bacterium]
MRFSTYFILISYLMAGTGLLAVSLTGIISPAFLIAISGIAVLSFFLSIQDKALHISRLVWNGLAIIILAAGLADYLLVSRSLIEVSVRFLTILMVAKLFDLRTNRDYAALYILTFFQLLAASAATVNLSFLFVLALYILTGIWALTLFTLKKDWEEKASPHKEMAKNILGPSFFLATAGLALLSLIITLSLFFVIPRMEVGFFSQQTADTIRVSGFSDKIDLGDIGPIKLDPTIVMRVELPGYKASAAPIRLYFRGIAFDAYNGAQWRQTMKELAPLQRNQEGIWRAASDNQGYATSSAILTQNILLEPIETNVLFAASNGIGVSGNFRMIMGDRMGSFYLPAPSYSRIEYTAYSILPSLAASVKPKEGYHGKAPRQYLQVPTGLENIYNLARDITAGRKTPFDKAAAIEGYLKKNYRYTLTPGKGAGKNPVEDFLFYTKAGYCEQYATAMAVMLRTIGIPSRLVTGFLPGEWNNFGNYLIIRQRDAHSWVEAYMPGTGWATFDPTPSAETVGGIPPATPLIALYIDSIRWRWNRYIINYSFRDQLRLARALEEKGRSLLSSLRWSALSRQLPNVGSRQKKLLFSFVAPITFVLILIAVMWIARKSGDKARWPRIPRFYKDALTFLAKKGKIKRPGETALEFAKMVNREEVMALTDIYYHVRFGGYEPTDAEKAQIEAYVTTMRRA